MCNSGWGAGVVSALASRVRVESYIGAGGSPPTPEVPGSDLFAHIASDRQAGQHFPAWMWVALDGGLLLRGTLDVNDQRQGHECHWEATGVGVRLRELIPSGGGDTVLRSLHSQGTVGATSAISSVLALWDRWDAGEQADWAAAFAPAKQPAVVWCDDDNLPVWRPVGDRTATEETRRASCRFEAERAGIWSWSLEVTHLSEQGHTATTTLHSDVSWFRPIVGLDSDRVTIG